MCGGCASIVGMYVHAYFWTVQTPITSTCLRTILLQNDNIFLGIMM